MSCFHAYAHVYVMICITPNSHRENAQGREILQEEMNLQGMQAKGRKFTLFERERRDPADRESLLAWEGL